MLTKWLSSALADKQVAGNLGSSGLAQQRHLALTPTSASTPIVVWRRASYGGRCKDLDRINNASTSPAGR
jgi:hypothetical protein